MENHNHLLCIFGRFHPEPSQFLVWTFRNVCPKLCRYLWPEPSSILVRTFRHLGQSLLEPSGWTFLAFGLEPTYVARTFWKLRLVMLHADEPCQWWCIVWWNLFTLQLAFGNWLRFKALMSAHLQVPLRNGVVYTVVIGNLHGLTPMLWTSCMALRPWFEHTAWHNADAVNREEVWFLLWRWQIVGSFEAMHCVQFGTFWAMSSTCLHGFAWDWWQQFAMYSCLSLGELVLRICFGESFRKNLCLATMWVSKL